MNQTKKTNYISTYNRNVHIFNITKYEGVINALQDETSYIRDVYLEHQIEHLQIKLQSIIPHKREKRGLINILGAELKYLSGTMDDNDRVEKEDKLSILMTNTHNVIIQLTTKQN